MTDQPSFKYNHCFSISFSMPSNIDPEDVNSDPAIESKLYEEMEQWALDVIKHGCYSVEWYDTEDLTQD